MKNETTTTLVHGTFKSLRQPNFRLWVVGQGISQIGYHAQLVALALLVLQLTSSGVVLGVVLSLNFIPNLVVGPVAGLLSDRCDKRLLLGVSQSIIMACSLTMGWLVLAGAVTVVWVFGLVAVSGLAFAFDQPARRTIVTELVSDDDAANAVSLNGALQHGAKLIGPALAGLLINSIGIGWCFIANGISSIGVLVALVALDTGTMRRAEPIPRAPGQITEGFRYIRADRTACRLLAMLTTVALLGANWNVLLPLLVTRELHGTTATLALLMASMSVGSVLGTLWLARRADISVDLLARSCIAFGAASLLLAVSPTFAVAAAAAFLMGISSMILFNGGVVSLQLGAIPEMRGRVIAMYNMIVLGGYAIGSPIAGAVAEFSSSRAALAIGGGASLTAGVAARRSCSAQHRRGVPPRTVPMPEASS